MSIDFIWDDEAKVWYAVCEEIGLALESEYEEILMQRVEQAIPELLELNHISIYPVNACRKSGDK